MPPARPERPLRISEQRFSELRVADPNRVPPEVKLPSVNLATLSAPLAEYREKFSAVKERHLRGRQYWYLNLLGRDPNRNDPGMQQPHND